ncbi:MAG: hypothetical protein ACXV7J_00880 [Methylomonas sp.]
MQIMVHYADDIVFTSPFVTSLLDQPDGMIPWQTCVGGLLQGLAKFPELNFKRLHVLAGVTSLPLIYTGVHDLAASEVMEFYAEGNVTKSLAH